MSDPKLPETVWAFRWPIKSLALGPTGARKRFLGAGRTRLPTRRERWEVLDVIPRGAFLRKSAADPTVRTFSLRTGVCMEMPDFVLSLTAKRELREYRRAKWGKKRGETTFRGERRT